MIRKYPIKHKTAFTIMGLDFIHQKLCLKSSPQYQHFLTLAVALHRLAVWGSWCNLMTDVWAAGLRVAGLRVAERVHGVLGSDTDVWLECLPCGCVCVWQKSAMWHPLPCHWGTAKASLSLALHSQSNLQGITIHSTLTSIYTQHKAC